MTSPFPGRLLAAAIWLLLPLSMNADESQPGDLWEVTSKMSMQGMPYDMPANTLKVCAAKNVAEPPGSTNDERGCANSEIKKVDNKVTFKSVCAGPPAMTGEGEIIFEGTDSYTGTIKYVIEGGSMTINLTGKKIGGCDNPS